VFRGLGCLAVLGALVAEEAGVFKLFFPGYIPGSLGTFGSMKCLFSVAWSKMALGQGLMSVGCSLGNVYFSSGGWHRVFCMQAKSGSLVWSNC